MQNSFLRYFALTDAEPADDLKGKAARAFSSATPGTLPRSTVIDALGSV